MEPLLTEFAKLSSALLVAVVTALVTVKVALRR